MKIGNALNDLMAQLAAGDDASRKAQRSAAVNVAWRNAVEAVYKDAAEMVLAHVNAVYIMGADEVVAGAPVKTSRTGTGSQLVVYSDDSMIRSDLDARQEFLKMKLKEQGEHVETFRILPSRFEMKSRHPFARAEDARSSNGAARTLEGPARPTLTPEEQELLDASVEAVENPAVRAALARAIHADTHRK